MKQTLFLQMWHGYWRVRKPVPKAPDPGDQPGQYLAAAYRGRRALAQSAA